MGYDEYRGPPPRRAGGGCGTVLGNAALLLIGALLLAITFFMVGLWQQGDRFLTGFDDLFNKPQPTPQVDVTAVVIQQIRGASELTTTVFDMQTVAEATQDRVAFGIPVGTTRLLYIAQGTVRAGVDLSQIGPDDVQIISDTIALRLPPPVILDSKIDVNRSRVYDMDRGFLNLGPEGMGLQSAAEQQALAQIVASACSMGVLDEANRAAEVALTKLLGLSGYRQVIVVVTPPTSCGVTVPPPVPIPTAGP